MHASAMPAATARIWSRSLPSGSRAMLFLTALAQRKAFFSPWLAMYAERSDWL